MRMKNFLAMFMTVITASPLLGGMVRASGEPEDAEREMERVLESAAQYHRQDYSEVLREANGYDVLDPLLRLLSDDSGSIRGSGVAISNAAERVASDIVANYKLESIELDPEKRFITKVVFEAVGRPPIIFSCNRCVVREHEFYNFQMALGDCEKNLLKKLSIGTNITSVLPGPNLGAVSWAKDDRNNIERVMGVYQDNPCSAGKFYHQYMFQTVLRNNLTRICGAICANHDAIKRSEDDIKTNRMYIYDVRARYQEVMRICLKKMENLERKFDLWLLAEISERLYTMLSVPSVTPLFAHASLDDTVSCFSRNLARYICDQVKNQYISGNLHV